LSTLKFSDLTAGIMLRWKIIALLVALCATAALADDTTTQADADDPPVSAAVAPSYIAIGRQLSLRMATVRRTLDDLTLDPPVRTQANEIVESCKKEVDDLVSQMQNGPMPSAMKVLGEPARLRAAQQALYQLIGPDQSQLLDEMMRSMRGQARAILGNVGMMLDDSGADAAKMKACQKILADAQAEAESLPRLDVPDAEYEAQRKRMDDLLAKLRDKLISQLSDDDLQRLEPKFDQLLPPVAAP
jgi:hypothetical protein